MHLLVVHGEVDGDHVVPNPMKQKGRLGKRRKWGVPFCIRDELVTNRHFPARSVVKHWYFSILFPLRELVGCHLGCPPLVEVEGRRKEDEPDDFRVSACQQSCQIAAQARTHHKRTFFREQGLDERQLPRYGQATKIALVQSGRVEG